MGEALNDLRVKRTTIISIVLRSFTIKINDAHISDKVLTKTQPVDFIIVSQPVAEFGLLAFRTLPREFLELSRSSLVLEPERHQGSIHGCVRSNESENNVAESKYDNHELMFQSRWNDVVRAVQFEMTNATPKFQNQMLLLQHDYRPEKFRDDCLIYENDSIQNLTVLKSTEPPRNEKQKFQQSCLQEMLELKSGELRNDESVDVFGRYCQFCTEPISFSKPTLPHYDEAVPDQFMLSTKDPASSVQYAPGLNFNIFSTWQEPGWKFPFLLPLPGYREEQAVHVCRSAQPDTNRHEYMHKSGELKNDQLMLGLTEVSREEVAFGTSKSPFERFSGEPLPTWSTRNLLLQLVCVIIAYNLFLEGLQVPSSSKMYITYSGLE